MKLLPTCQRVAAIVGGLITAAPIAMATEPAQTKAAPTVPPTFTVASSLTAAPSSGITSRDNLASLRADLSLPHSAAPPVSSSLPFGGRPNGALPGTTAASIADTPTTAEQSLAGIVNISWPRPPLVAVMENSQHQGMPIVHLWENSRVLSTIRLNRHGIPGIYVVRKLP